jgi:hypothetical protein
VATVSHCKKRGEGGKLGANCLEGKCPRFSAQTDTLIHAVPTIFHKLARKLTHIKESKVAPYTLFNLKTESVG